MTVTVLPIWPYLAVTVPLVMTPGASTAIVLRNSMAGGTRAGVETAIGINAGAFCYGLLSAFGFALTLHRWPSVWEALRIAGAAYLAWLGIRSVHRALSREVSVDSMSRHVPSRGRFAHAYEGFLTNALNPAIATFYLIILPQFIPREAPVARSVLILTAVHISLAITWHVAWAAAGGRLSRSLTSGAPRRVIDACAGIALVALAVSMLFARNNIVGAAAAYDEPDSLEIRMAELDEQNAQPDTTEAELTEIEKRDTVIRLAFGGNLEQYDAFCRCIRDAITEGTGVVLRGSAVTGCRWKDGVPFDADGPGTSDLDLTLVGDDVIGLFKVTGFFVPEFEGVKGDACPLRFDCHGQQV